MIGSVAVFWMWWLKHQMKSSASLLFFLLLVCLFFSVSLRILCSLSLSGLSPLSLLSRFFCFPSLCSVMSLFCFSLFLPCFSVLSSLFVFVLFFILKSPPPVLFSSLYIFPHSFFFSTPLPSLSPGIYKWKTRERELLSLSSHGTGVGGWAATRQPL